METLLDIIIILVVVAIVEIIKAYVKLDSTEEKRNA